MSKVNVDEIQVGDLVEYTFEDDKCLGYVIELYDGGLRAFWSDSLSECNEDFEDQSITGHWKVINFEEESKVNDELKVYTGKETIEALLEGKVLSWTTKQFKLDGKFLYEKNDPNEWTHSFRSVPFFMGNKFTEVVAPQVGDWVRVFYKDDIFIGKLKRIEDSHQMWAVWNKNGTTRVNSWLDITNDWEILSPEQVSEYKRELAFSKVGRKLNEFHEDDFVMIDSLSIVGVVTSKNNTDELRIHKLNEVAGYTAKPNQVTPIYFSENQVDLS